MEDKIQTTNRGTFKKYDTPLDLDGSGENLIEFAMVSETLVKDVDTGTDVVITRKETPIKGQTKASLLTQIEANRLALLERHAKELADVDAQIAQFKQVAGIIKSEVKTK